MAGARWVQENILETRGWADLKVYAVWLPMVPTDARSMLDTGLLSDGRVRHFWDGSRSVGRWFAGWTGGQGVAWDIYYLYAADAAWQEGPEPLFSSGRTVIGTRQRLAAAVGELLEKQ